MCEPVSIALAVASIAMAAVKSKMANDAAKADYYGKVQASQATAVAAQEARRMNTESLIAKREVAERQFTKDSIDSTVAAEIQMSKAATQGANGGVANNVFNMFNKHAYMQDQNNQTSILWNLQLNGENLARESRAAYEKQKGRLWSSRPGVAPVNTFGVDMVAAGISAVGTGLSTYSAMGKAGLLGGSTSSLSTSSTSMQGGFGSGWGPSYDYA